MKKLLSVMIGLAMGLFCFASVAYAQDGGEAASASGLIAIGAGLAMGLGAAGCGMAQGRAAASALEGVARNPSAAAKIQTQLILGLALIESIAIYSLLIGILLFTKV